MSWFKKEKTPLAPMERSRMPEGLWTKCRECSEILYTKEIVRNLSVCPKCNYHIGLSSVERAKSIFDDQRDLKRSRPVFFRTTRSPSRTPRITATGSVWARNRRASMMLFSSLAGVSMGFPLCSRPWNMASSEAAWGSWSAKRSREPSSTLSRSACRSSSCRGPEETSMNEQEIQGRLNALTHGS